MAADEGDSLALDFQDSLQDLQINNRYEISNLTIIAKENTEHAQAISQVLEKHIKTVGRLRLRRACTWITVSRRNGPSEDWIDG